MWCWLQAVTSIFSKQVHRYMPVNVTNHPGSVGVTLEIYDDEAKLDMPSRTSKVQLDDQFVSDLEELCIPGKAQYRLDLKH